MNQVEQFKNASNYRDGKFVFTWVKTVNPLASEKYNNIFTAQTGRGVYVIKWNVGTRVYELFYNSIVVKRNDSVLKLKKQARIHYVKEAL